MVELLAPLVLVAAVGVAVACVRHANSLNPHRNPGTPTGPMPFHDPRVVTCDPMGRPLPVAHVDCRNCGRRWSAAVELDALAQARCGDRGVARG